MKTGRHIFGLLAALPALLPFSGCKREDMHNQARHEWHERSDFFADEMSSRPQVEGTVARGQPLRSDPLVSWRSGDRFADAYPFPVDRVALERGRQRFEIYCSMCHGATGYGDGMIVRRGFVTPPSFHDQRLRDAPPGYFVEVISNGYGAMYGYNDRVTPADRWKIAAYVKTLQLSRRVEMASLSADERARVEEAAATTRPADPSRSPRRQAEGENRGMRGAGQ
jgi:mono/diheme cytochrome c family protein